MTVCTPSFIGLAKHQIEIQSYSLADDGFGGQTPTWSTTYTIWAMIEPRTGKEFIFADQRENEVNANITIRYIAALANTQVGAKYRIKFGARYYNILSVQNLSKFKGKFEGTAYQVFSCKEIDEKVA